MAQPNHKRQFIGNLMTMRHKIHVQTLRSTNQSIVQSIKNYIIYNIFLLIFPLKSDSNKILFIYDYESRS